MHKPFLSDQYVRQFGLKSLRLGRALETGFVFTLNPGSILMNTLQHHGLPLNNSLLLLITLVLNRLKISVAYASKMI